MFNYGFKNSTVFCNEIIVNAEDNNIDSDKLVISVKTSMVHFNGTDNWSVSSITTPDQQAGHILILINTGDYVVTLKHMATDETIDDANKIFIPIETDFPLYPNRTVFMTYTDKWLMFMSEPPSV